MYLIHKKKKEKIDGEKFENLPLNMDFFIKKNLILKSILSYLFIWELAKKIQFETIQMSTSYET
jgi:hypothetical protein